MVHSEKLWLFSIINFLQGLLGRIIPIVLIRKELTSLLLRCTSYLTMILAIQSGP